MSDKTSVSHGYVIKGKRRWQPTTEEPGCAMMIVNEAAEELGLRAVLHGQHDIPEAWDDRGKERLGAAGLEKMNRRCQRPGKSRSRGSKSEDQQQHPVSSAIQAQKDKTDTCGANRVDREHRNWARKERKENECVRKRNQQGGRALTFAVRVASRR